MLRVDVFPSLPFRRIFHRRCHPDIFIESKMMIELNCCHWHAGT